MENMYSEIMSLLFLFNKILTPTQKVVVITFMTFNGLIQPKLAHSRSIIKICALIFIETNKKETLRMCKMVFVCTQYMDVTGNVFLCDMCENPKNVTKELKTQ